MKTGMAKFKNVMDPDTCDLLIKHLDDNLDKCDDLNHSNKQNVVCKEIMLEPNSELDTMVLETIQKALASYSQKYPFFQGRARTGYQLRKITGNTRVHVDRNPYIDDKRNVSVIIGLNSDYEKGEFHFPEQDYITTVKRAEAIIFPV